MDAEGFQKDVPKVVQFITEYWTDLVNRRLPVTPNFEEVLPGFLLRALPQYPPDKPEDLARILDDLKNQILPGMVHWQHPNFHGYYPTPCTYSSLLGDMISDAFAVVGFNWLSCPALTELEVVTLNWLANILDLPKKFQFNLEGNDDNKGCGGGMIENSTCLSCLSVCIAVRNKCLQELRENTPFTNRDCLKGQGPGAMADRMTVYYSDQVHCSMSRAVRMAMLNAREIPSERHGKRLVFNAERLRQAIALDRAKGFIPVMCIATSGTIGTCDFDDLDAIGQVCEKEKIWFHVDAAYAGAAMICPEYRALFNGMDRVDSLTINAHKLLMVNLDFSVLWISDYKLLTNALANESTYLHHDFHGMPDYKNWSLSLGRRFRALKLWFVLRMIGVEGIQHSIREHARLAELFKNLILADGRFEVVNEVQFGLVCFRHKAGEEVTRALHKRILKQRELFLVPNHLPEAIEDAFCQIYLRFTCNTQATEEYVRKAVSWIAECTDDLA